MKKAVIYVKHKTNSFSPLESKIARCKEFAQNVPLEIIDVYWDQVKHNGVRRWALEQMLNDCKADMFDYVLIPNIQSLTRNFDELRKIRKIFKRHNVTLLDVQVLNDSIKNLKKAGILQ